MNGDSMSEVLHAVGLGVAQLRQQVADATAARDSTNQYASDREHMYQQERQRAVKLESDLAVARANAERYRKQAQEIAEDRDGHVQRGGVLLDDYDGLTLRLWNYAAELAAAREVEKVKSSKVMLGHIVERLKEIHAYRSPRPAPAQPMESR